MECGGSPPLFRLGSWEAVCFGAFIVGSLAVQAQVFEFETHREIPDGDGSGLADVRTLPPAGAAIRSLAVTLKLTPVGEGGFVGDLYATLAHEGGGYAVLLNRSGRQPGSPLGYSDDVGLSITLMDGAPADIHHYRLTLNGSHALPLTASLTGPWQPDGRAVDPTSVLASDDRQSRLASFVGADVGGRWTLFVADVSSGGQYRLESWSLSVTSVPEPSELLAVLGLGALGWVVSQRRTRRA